jgi:hypothetical protein
LAARWRVIKVFIISIKYRLVESVNTFVSN